MPTFGVVRGGIVYCWRLEPAPKSRPLRADGPMGLIALEVQLMTDAVGSRHLIVLDDMSITGGGFLAGRPQHIADTWGGMVMHNRSAA